MSTYLGLCMDRQKNYSVYGILMFSWAMLVAISRIFVGKHYLGDVIMGICIGILAGLFFAWLARMIVKRYAND